MSTATGGRTVSTDGWTQFRFDPREQVEYGTRPFDRTYLVGGVTTFRQYEVDLGQVLPPRLPTGGGRGQAADRGEDPFEAGVTDELPLDLLDDLAAGLERRSLVELEAKRELTLGQIGDQIRAQQGRRPDR